MSKVGDAFVEISAKDAHFTKGMDKAENKLAKFGARSTAASGKFTHGMAQMRTAIGLLSFAMAGLALGGGVSTILDKFAEQEKQTAKLNAVLKATGNSAGFSSKELQGMASELQRVTTTGDEAILKLMAIVGTFKGIKGDQFKKVTENVLDLAIILETDAKSAAIQLGKALNAPIEGITALSRAGVQFNESQKAQIKGFVETNQLMKAQELVLKEVEGQVGGTARALRDTYGGSVDAVKNSFGDMKEGLGELVVEFFNLEEVNNDLAEAFTNTEKSIKDLANSPGLIAFSELMRGTLAEVILEFQFATEEIELLGSVIGRTLFNIGQNVNSTGRIIGRAIGNMINDTDLPLDEVIQKTESAVDLIDAKMKDNEKRREAFREVFQKRLAARLKKNTDEMIDEEKKGTAGVVDEENKKKAARDTTLNSFADIIKEAQKASSAGIAAGGFGAGGGAAGANPPGTTTADKLTTTGDSNTAILQDLLTQAKLMVTGINKMTVFG